MLPAQMKIYPDHPAASAGFSLVELMVSIVIGLFLLLGLTTMLVNTSSANKEMEKSSRQIENGRYAIQVLSDDIRLAGYDGEYSPPTGTTTPYIDKTAGTPVVIDPCTTTVANLGWNNATPQSPVAIYGYAGNAATSAVPLVACATAMANRPTPAVGMPAMLTVRRAQTVSYAATAAVGGTTYLQVSLCPTPTTNPPFILAASSFTMQTKDCATANTIHKYTVNTYFIDSCNVCTPSSDGIPTLKLVQFVDGALTVVPLVEGIEDMQFDYGIDNDNDGSPDTYLAAPAATDWPNVVAVRIYLLARNSESSANYTENGTYDMGIVGKVSPCGTYSGGSIGTANAPFKAVTSCSNFKRHAYSALVRVENVSARREVP